MARVSLITVTYNTPAEIIRLFESIKRHLPEGTWEWIVADNQSREDISSQLPGVTYLRLPENYGFAKACNLAAQKATSPYLFFVNPDCILVEDCVSPLIESLALAAVVGPRVKYPDESLQLSFGPFLSIAGELMQMVRMRNENRQIVQRWIRKKLSGPFSPDWISGCAFAVSSNLFRANGGFDEAFFLYEEDVDFCKRLHAKGMRVLLVPSVSIVHERGQSTKQESSAVEKHYRRSQLYYYKKHHGFSQQLLLRLLLTFKYLRKREMLRLIWKTW